MKKRFIRSHLHGFVACPLAAALVLCSCYPERSATIVNKNYLDTVTVVKAPAKVFLTDASVAIFPRGFHLENGTIRGQGWRYSSIGTVEDIPLEKLRLTSLHFSKDSAVAMTYYDEVVTLGRGVASFFHGLYGAVLTPLSIYCLSNPKACFGCCPTVYTRSGNSWEFQAELFSYSVSKPLEADDLDKLNQHVSPDSPFTLRVANEALETHCINMMQLVAVDHPAGTVAYPTTDGDFVAVKNLCTPISAINSEGRDVLSTVRFLDGQAYRSDSDMVQQVKSGRISDWVEFRVRPPQGSRTATLVMNLKNSLLSTVLFYEVVLGSQGVQAIDWTERMNSDRAYAALFRSVYRQFSGVRLLMLRDGVWESVGNIPDPGPVGWKQVAIKIPAEDNNDLLLRMEFFPDNILIDHLAVDFTGDGIPIESHVFSPTAVKDRTGSSRPDILPLIQEGDNQYLVTEPRDVYRFMYNLPSARQSEMTLFVRSRGYYTEWIRGGWIAQSQRSEQFNLFHIDRTMVRLADLWIKERQTMELLFFRNRIPVSEEL